MGTYGGILKLYNVCGQKLNNLMWLRMAGYRKYISYRYVFISFFVSLKKYAGRKLNTLMWLRMAGEFMYTYFFAYGYLANVSSLDYG